MTRKRLDNLLVERGLFPSREQAQRAVLAGRIRVSGRLADKPGQQVAEDCDLYAGGEERSFVSRGGEKLAGALDFFGMSIEGLVCADLGASTGGFTDCLLQQGAARVYAIDVGRGQLAWKLRRDPRVTVLEGKNARYLEPGDLPEPCRLVTIDVAFISLRLILPAALGILAQDGEIVALIKPQFEAGRGQVGKRGVVRDERVHASVLAEVTGAAEALGLGLAGLTYSRLKGPEGNLEFFARWTRGRGKEEDRGPLIERVVEEAHRL